MCWRDVLPLSHLPPTSDGSGGIQIVSGMSHVIVAVVAVHQTLALLLCSAFTNLYHGELSEVDILINPISLMRKWADRGKHCPQDTQQEAKN